MNTELLQQATALDIDEQIELVEAIWDNIANRKAAPPLTELQQKELERRLENYLANPNDVQSWQEMKTAVLQKVTLC